MYHFTIVDGSDRFRIATGATPAIARGNAARVCTSEINSENDPDETIVQVTPDEVDDHYAELGFDVIIAKC